MIKGAGQVDNTPNPCKLVELASDRSNKVLTTAPPKGCLVLSRKLAVLAERQNSMKNAEDSCSFLKSLLICLHDMRMACMTGTQDLTSLARL
jgi:hypothetical protein